MQLHNRRTFIKNCGIGAGAIMASGLVYSNLTGQGIQKLDNDIYENIFGFAKEDMEKALQAALSKGGDFADLFFEYTVSNSMTMAEDIIKSSSQNIQLGVGIRTIKGEQTGYAYTNDLTLESVLNVALTAATIARGGSGIKTANLNVQNPINNVYGTKLNITDAPLKDKILMLSQGYDAAKNYDKRISKISSTIGDEMQILTIANSEGLLISDIRPQARFMVSATAEENGTRSTGLHNAGGRIGLDFYHKGKSPEEIGKKAAEEAIILLSAIEAPAGEQPVVLGKDQSGVMIHEAVGHPLEADGIWKKTSIMSEKPILINASRSLSIVTLSPNCPLIAGATAAITVLLFFIRSATGRK